MLDSISPAKSPRPITPAKSPGPITPAKIPGPITPAKGPGPITPAKSPGPITPAKSPGPITPAKSPGSSLKNITPEIANLLERKKKQGKLINQSGKCRIYDLGEGILCKQRPMLPKKYEGATLSYVRQHTDIPVPKVYAEYVDVRTGVYFLFLEKIPGRTLHDAWRRMGRAPREAAADSVAGYARQLNNLTSSALESVTHGPLFDKHLFSHEDQPYGPFKSIQDLYERLASEFHPRLSDGAAKNLRSGMPPSATFSLCHGNLAAENVIVDGDGVVVGLIDWEDSGFFPSWWEVTKLTVEGEKSGNEWRSMLKTRLVQCPQAEKFMGRVKAFRFRAQQQSSLFGLPHLRNSR